MGEPVIRLLKAAWVFPIASAPLQDGAVAVAGERIAAVGGRRELEGAFPSARVWDLGEAALLPGLINCHTHLELGRLVAPEAAESFVSWVIRLLEARRALPPGAPAAAAQAGARELLGSGTTAVGDISTGGESLAPLRSLGLRGVIFREVLGLPPGEAAARAGAAREGLERLRREAAGSRLRVGLSPHSPYSLSEELFRCCGGLLQAERMPCAIHAAESREEVEFLAGGGGPLPGRLYPAVGCVSPPPRRTARSPVAYLAAQGALAWRPILVHAVHVDGEDVRLVARSGASVAHCPRSNARLSQGIAPVADFLRGGVPVGLGTDSLAGVPSLSLWDEMRAALGVHGGGLSPQQVLGLATLGGARVLGMSDRVGSLTPGKAADLIAVPAGPIEAADPAGSLIAGTCGAVRLSLIGGEVCYRQPEVGAWA